MAPEIIFGFTCVLLVQMISGRCFPSASRSYSTAPIAFPIEATSWDTLNKPRFGFGIDKYSASYGGVFEVYSSSPIAPTGVSVYSENTIQGRLSVAGTLPFLGTVAVDGALPTVGGGSVQYSAGDGNVAITREGGLRAC